MISWLVSILIFIVIAAVILWFASYILSLVPVGQTPKNLILAVIALLLLLAFLMQTGLLKGDLHPLKLITFYMIGMR